MEAALAESESSEKRMEDELAELATAEHVNDFFAVLVAGTKIAKRLGSFAKAESLFREHGCRVHLVAKGLGVERELLFADGSVGRGTVEAIFSTKADAKREQLEARGTLEENLRALDGAGSLTAEDPKDVIEYALSLPAGTITDVRLNNNEEEWIRVLEVLRNNVEHVRRRRLNFHFATGTDPNRILAEIAPLKLGPSVGLCVDRACCCSLWKNLS